MMFRDGTEKAKSFIGFPQDFVCTQACVFFGTLDGLQGPLSALLSTAQQTWSPICSWTTR